MGNSRHLRALCATLLAYGLAWISPATELKAASILTPGSAELIRKSATEPFGLPTALLSAGGLRDKWLGVLRRLDDELVQLAICEGDREGCKSPEALRFLAIV